MLRTGATVEKLEGQKLTVKTDSERAGAYIARQPERCALPATVADVKAGQFIGCTAVEGPDGKLRERDQHPA
jgi:hypothetical protein